MTSIVSGTNGFTFNDSTTQSTSAFFGGLAFRNRIINGAMMIDQRNAGASVNIGVSTATSQYTLDRWNFDVSQAPKISVQQSTNAPTGFSNSLLVTSLAATTVGSGDYFQVNQKVEGFNTADLVFGTASAATVTLSFWVKSSLTGSFSGALKNSAANRSYPFSYTINAANTWEQKTVTIAGDQSGTWVGGTNGIGINVNFSLGMGSTYSGSANAWASANYGGVTGSVNMVATNAATWQVTGVQLEKGSTATSFDYRPYGTELALCQRYFETNVKSGVTPADGAQVSDRTPGVAFATTTLGVTVNYLVFKRAQATITFYAGSNQYGSAGKWAYFNGSSWVQVTSQTAGLGTQNSVAIDMNASGFSSTATYLTQGVWTASAEL